MCTKWSQVILKKYYAHTYVCVCVCFIIYNQTNEFEQTPGVGDGQGGLVCFSPWGRKESDTTEQLNWELN